MTVHIYYHNIVYSIASPKVIKIDEATLLSTNGKHIIIIDFYVVFLLVVDSSEEINNNKTFQCQIN